MSMLMALNTSQSNTYMDTTNVTRIEVIDHTKALEDGGGRCYTFWSQYDKADIKKPKVEVYLQDGGRTLKVFISNKQSND
jgi:hypothetical protein